MAHVIAVAGKGGVGGCLIIAATCKYGKGNTKKESQQLHVFPGVIIINCVLQI